MEAWRRGELLGGGWLGRCVLEPKGRGWFGGGVVLLGFEEAVRGRCLLCISIVRLYEEYSLQQEAVPWPLGKFISHL